MARSITSSPISRNLTNQALPIRKMHNLAHLCTKFQDDVRMIRKLFTMMAEKEDELLSMMKCVTPS